MRSVCIAACLAAMACGPTQLGSDPDAGLEDASTAGPDSGTDASAVDAAVNPPDFDAAPPAFAHTIVIDGANDFSPDERLATSSASFDAFVTWDAEFLYLGLRGPDVASVDGRRFWLVYIGGPGGSGGMTEGEIYNTQRPALSFEAGFHVRWKADNTFTSAMEPDRAVWVDNDWDLTGDVFQAGEFVELRLARADLGSPDVVALHMSMVNETNLAEGTFAGAPAISFADGYDPDYGHHFEFDLLGSGPPFAAVPSP